MKKLPKLFILSFVICHLSFVISVAEAQLKDFTINADKIAYEKEKQLIEAEGSVEVIYKDFTLHGNHMLYNTSSETFLADRGFKFDYHGVQLAGDTIIYDREKYELKNASFTSCDLPAPHYRVTARDVLLYPKYDWMVAYWGFFWLGNFPLVPMPTYIYDFRAAEKAQKNLPPFPEIGANEEDGNYISEKLVWHLRPEFSGTYTLNYASNKGIGGGIEANYLVNQQNSGNVRINGNYKDGLFGGITHHLLFGNEVETLSSIPINFMAAPHFRQFELESTLSFRERINYQKVSQTPNFRIIARGKEYSFEAAAGQIAEAGNTRLLRGIVNGRLFREIGYFTPSLAADTSFYSDGNHWIKPAFELDFARKLRTDLFLNLGYIHYFFIDGTSPFNFELYRFRAADRLKSSLLFKAGETRCKISSSYFLDNWSPEDIDYSLFFTLHCYNLEMTYRSMRKEFLLGFSLGGF